MKLSKRVCKACIKGWVDGHRDPVFAMMHVSSHFCPSGYYLTSYNLDDQQPPDDCEFVMEHVVSQKVKS